MKFFRVIASMSIIAIAMIGFIYFGNGGATSIESNNGRNVYEGINQSVFADLPEIPDNFVMLRRYIHEGQITDLNKVLPDMYKQPEFYPTWERNGLKWFTNHDYSRWGVHGYGFFPGEIGYSVSDMAKDDVLDVYSFLHTSWGIETWQGLKLIPKYNSTYFDVVITPNEVRLDPTFPKFYYNWSRKIEYKIVAKEQIPIGIYEFSVTFGSPSSEISNKWMWQTIDEYTDKKYSSEIQACMDSLAQNDRCAEFIELRQNRYISSGGAFAPSAQYKVILNVN